MAHGIAALRYALCSMPSTPRLLIFPQKFLIFDIAARRGNSLSRNWKSFFLVCF
jgi:hypothetical protein